jgi:hypothetical protein
LIGADRSHLGRGEYRFIVNMDIVVYMCGIAREKGRGMNAR